MKSVIKALNIELADLDMKRAKILDMIDYITNRQDVETETKHPAVRKRDNTRGGRVLEYLQKSLVPVALIDIHKATAAADEPYSATNSTIKRMVDEKLIERTGRGLYVATTKAAVISEQSVTVGASV